MASNTGKIRETAYRDMYRFGRDMAAQWVNGNRREVWSRVTAHSGSAAASLALEILTHLPASHRSAFRQFFLDETVQAVLDEYWREGTQRRFL